MTHSDVLRRYMQVYGSEGSQTGNERSTLCPTCRNPSRKFYVNLEKGIGYCFHCNQRDPKVIFDSMASMLSGSVGPGGTPSGGSMYPATPVYTPKAPPPLTWKYVEQSQANLVSLEHRHAYTYLKDKRHLTPEIIKFFKLGYDPIEKAIVIPNYNGQNLYGFSLRYLDPDARPKYKYYGKKFLYNSNYLVLRMDSCVLFEGELNAASSVQLINKLPAFALQGKSVFKQGYINILRRYDKVYLFLDDDADEETRKIIEKLGPYRCFIVKLPHKYKDLNDALADPDPKGIYYKALREAECPVTPILASVKDFSKRATDAYSGKQYKAWSTGWEALDTITGGVRPGEITVLTGYTGVGKSHLALALALQLRRQGVKPCIASFELPIATSVLPILLSFTLQRNIEVYKLPPHVFEALLDLFGAQTGTKFINRDGQMSIEEFLFGMDLAYRNGYRAFIIDHLHFFVPPGPNERADEDALMYSLVAFKKSHPEASIILIAHHKKVLTDYKTGQPRPITLGDVKGTSRITQDADNLWIINKDYRGGPPILSVEKLRTTKCLAIVGGAVKLAFDKGKYSYCVIPA